MVRRGGHSGGVRGPRQGQQAAITDGHVVEKLIPGRHLCKCQARVHELIRNCMGCGKIVCAQEGSGPCLYCGTLVCTREEREILERGSRKSAELYKKLTGEELPVGVGAFSLCALGKEVERAVQFRDKLLSADADTERRTRVNDLESDYSNIERNPYLTKEERAEIMRRREELRRIREERRRAVVVDIDLASKSARTAAPELHLSDPAYDPVIRAILDRSDARKNASDATKSAVDAHWVPKGFVPKYSRDSAPFCNTSDFENIDAEVVCMANEVVAALTEQKAFALSLPQPQAALLANGRIRFIRWHEDLHVKGPVFICANTSSVSSQTIEDFHKKYVKGSFSLPLDYSPGCIQGRAYLNDTLTLSEFNDEVGNVDVPGHGDFVLVFSSHEPLTIPVPHIPPGEFFQLEKALRDALSHCFAS